MQGTWRPLVARSWSNPVSSSETCVLSLNGRDALSESDTLAELGIVSGDLLYVLRHSHGAESEERKRDVEIKAENSTTSFLTSRQPEDKHIKSLCRGSSHSTSISAVPSNHMSAQDKALCVSKDATKTTSSTINYQSVGTSVVPAECCHDSPAMALCSALNGLMMESGFCPVLVSCVCICAAWYIHVAMVAGRRRRRRLWRC